MYTNNYAHCSTIWYNKIHGSKHKTIIATFHAGQRTSKELYEPTEYSHAGTK